MEIFPWLYIYRLLTVLIFCLAICNHTCTKESALFRYIFDTTKYAVKKIFIESAASSLKSSRNTKYQKKVNAYSLQIWFCYVIYLIKIKRYLFKFMYISLLLLSSFSIKCMKRSLFLIEDYKILWTITCLIVLIV